jgi:hypothetical protein
MRQNGPKDCWFVIPCRRRAGIEEGSLMGYSLSHHRSPQKDPKKPRPPPVRGFFFLSPKQRRTRPCHMQHVVRPSSAPLRAPNVHHKPVRSWLEAALVQAGALLINHIAPGGSSTRIEDKQCPVRGRSEFVSPDKTEIRRQSVNLVHGQLARDVRHRT